MRKTFLAGALGLMAFGITQTGAVAADLPIYYEEYEIKEKAGAWYLRGDIGYVITTDLEVTYDGSAGHQEFYEEHFDNTWLIGFGFGYKFSHYFRADITIDYRADWNFEGETICASACTSHPVNYEHGSMSMWTVLGNVYLDWDNHSSFTPYIGGGLGFAYIDVDKHFAANGGGGNSLFDEEGNWNFAAAAMAGFVYDVNHNWAIDANYRYLWVGDVDTGPSLTSGLTGKITYEDMDFHEIRVGARYTFH